MKWEGLMEQEQRQLAFWITLWLLSPSDSCIEALTPKVTVFETEPLRRQARLAEVIRVGHSSNVTCVCIK